MKTLRNTTSSKVASLLPVRRGLDHQEAAIYVAMSLSLFDAMVADGRMPRPRLANTKKVWDIDELDLYFKSLPRDEAKPEKNTWDDFRNGGVEAQAR